MDKIFIRDLAVPCVIGVSDEERREKQEVLINVALWVDLRKAARTDSFLDAVDYRGIKKRMIKAVESSEYYLVEALAERIAEVCLENGDVRRVRVTLEKPGALRFAKSVGVEITRDRT